jgi:hypothetical protein
MRLLLISSVLALAPLVAVAQSAGEVERCFQNPGSCSHSGGAPAPPAPAPGPAASGVRPTPSPPDYTSVLQSPEPERRKIQESLRTLDKYSGPIDGDLQSEGTTKAITDWQKGHGYAAVGKLTPTEAVTLNNEAARVPIRRVNPSSLASSAPATITPPSNAAALKALRARLAERRKAAEPKAAAATLALFHDLKAYIAADGKGIAGEQFSAFAKWYADTKAAGRTVGDIRPNVEDYGDAKTGQAATAEVVLQAKQGENSYPQCLVFAWIEGNPRKNTHAFSCDDVAGVEKWKSEQALRSAWR